MKRILLFVILGMILSISGCGNHAKPDNTVISSDGITSSEKTASAKADKSPESDVSDEQNSRISDNREDQSISEKNITNTADTKKDIIIVIDPGHGKPSSLMSDNEKSVSGYVFVDGKGWGDWRHFKSGTTWQDCEGSGCSGRAPANGSCWYPIGHGDRNTEPDLNYNNAINAKKYLEQLGYTVRLTRDRDGNPSLTQRLKYCYPDCNTELQPDASAYICLHSNAGGGKGSCYISLSGIYDQVGIPANYAEAGNEIGKYINDSIVNNTSLTSYGSGRYDGYPELVLFCKSPVKIAYMEIGFYDNPQDLNILQTESENIGKSIADGIHSYFSNCK